MILNTLSTSMVILHSQGTSETGNAVNQYTVSWTAVCRVKELYFRRYMTGSLVEYSRKSESENFMLGNIFGDSRFYVSILSVIRHKVNLKLYCLQTLILIPSKYYLRCPYIHYTKPISTLSISISTY